MHIKLRPETPKRFLEEMRVNREDNKNVDVGVWTWSICLRTAPSDLIFGIWVHRREEFFSVPARLSTSQNVYLVICLVIIS
jgi:hypothetical protein